ncbi:unnamed protein product [Didymodactylos carnosus]|uniref:Helix-turn-helix domain-containing protein n=1 Tax=Didymodactylos carnosus TaxID=1234261 RepID=A0A815DU77_9BILA|nr:unnamed protein product [Didymodactylos carnosus]CAF1306106.1 unnamed protein product [Didymodactylos carnosus]CAF3665264.1 unnamed protein product [Didymodactylos carnosus]CAF4139466.1 unnamed protein product [Didymodactylos carnosus]
MGDPGVGKWLREDQVKELVEDLNSKTTNLKFTFEFEKNNKIPFLDVLIAIDKINKNFTTGWFRNEITSNYLLNFHSNHNLAMKNNIVKNMTNRVLIANNGHKNEKDLNHWEKILEHSQFPKNIKDRIQKEFNDNLIRSNNVNNNQQSSENIKLKHLQKHSKSIDSILNKTKLIPRNKLGAKKKDSSVFAKNAIYGIPDRCGYIYVGETEDFERRYKQHMSNVKYHRVNESEIVQHLLVSNSSCRIQFEKSLIFDREENKDRRKVLVAVYSIANKSYNNKRMICNEWKVSIGKWIGEKLGSLFRTKTKIINSNNNSHPNSHNIVSQQVVLELQQQGKYSLRAQPRAKYKF